MKFLRRSSSAVLYPEQYLWFVLLSLLDILMTAAILSIGGYEANALANRLLARFDVTGLVILKFCIVTFFVVVCEAVGKRNHVAGRRLVWTANLLTVVPIVVGSIELFIYAYSPA
jgi:hypothetical protein